MLFMQRLHQTIELVIVHERIKRILYLIVNIVYSLLDKTSSYELEAIGSNPIKRRI